MEGRLKMDLTTDDDGEITRVDEVDVLGYLHRLRNAAQTLATAPVEETDDSMDCEATSTAEENEGAPSSVAGVMEQIAEFLLEACRLEILAASIGRPLPPPPAYVQCLHDVLPSNDGEDDLAYRKRRVDYLRLLLRAMAPVAMDAASTVCSVIVEQQQQLSNKSEAAFVLLAFWLPVAPQIQPLVTDLFLANGCFAQCPLLSGRSSEQVLLWMEAAHVLCQFYAMRRREVATLLTWWNWSPVFAYLDQASTTKGVTMQLEENENNFADVAGVTIKTTYSVEDAGLWYAVRVAGYVRNYAAGCKADFFRKYGSICSDENVPWQMHPWDIDQEELVYEKLQFFGKSKVWWDGEEFALPSLDSVRASIPLHPYLVHVGEGLVFYKYLAITKKVDALTKSDSRLQHQQQKQRQPIKRLIRTPTTCENLARVGTALCIDLPILICAPHGAGKSSLVRELARMMHTDDSFTDDQENLLEIHVDEETDTKTLVGSYTATDIPGEFEWRPGALTRAVRTGKWVLLEDLDKVPMEIQASLDSLFKERRLPLGNGKTEPCHSNFRLFGTLTTTDTAAASRRGKAMLGRRVLHPALWTIVHVDPLPLNELNEIAHCQHPLLPQTVVESTLDVFRALDQSGRDDGGAVCSNSNNNKLWIGRHPSVRDLLKVLSRVANGVSFERDVKYATESQRTLCLAETADVFAAACPATDIRREFILKIAAPAWGVSADLAVRYVETRCPTIFLHEGSTEVGRVQITVSSNQAAARVQNSERFAQTDYALRLMESIGVCIRENEPTLLVGETGTGKTTILQHLAQCCGRELIVQNLSLQTDSADLLGGYRPLEMQHVARLLYQDFVNLFTGSFSRKQNADFLGFAASALQKAQWKKLSQCFRRAAQLGLTRLKGRMADTDSSPAWELFGVASERFEQQRLACDSGLAFVFSEGALVNAIRKGKWVLLDEINLASSETLQRLCGLLDDSSSSLTLTERGDAIAIERHPEFRLFAAMNPATDSGKKDLSASIRARFTELYVDELLDPFELRVVASRYISSVVPSLNGPPQHTETVISVVDLYLKCRDLAERVLVDGSGQKPRYTLRTLSRALTAARNLVLGQKLSLSRALYEGYQLAFQGPLDENSLKATNKVIYNILGKELDISHLNHPGKRPGGRGDSNKYTLIKPFWIKAGPLDTVDWSEENSATGCSRFIMIPSTALNLRRLARVIAAGPWPVLLEGPTSAGKTTLVEYFAARCGHHVVRINNHEHTDVQEYTGGFAADSNGSLSFMDGILVRALRLGHWVILDELNLAPSEVLEALNRLLDDNRELYLPEINETIKPHPNFRLFATQNPSGAYGGRKPLSRAFRNRFVEIQVNDIPSDELVTILEKKCGCPPSHCRMLVSIMDSLRQRRSKSGVFLGRDGFITPRDLLRWAVRGASSKIELANEGYMLLAERLRTAEEKCCVKEEIEKHLQVTVDLDALYYGEDSGARAVLNRARASSCSDLEAQTFISLIAPTKSLLRLITLVKRCVVQHEPVLLVGDTGCGKTAIVQLLSFVLDLPLHTVNCHQTTETSDLLGGLRPVRGRSALVAKMEVVVRKLVDVWPDKDALANLDLPEFLQSYVGNELDVRPGLPEDAALKMIDITRTLWATLLKKSNEPGIEPRRSKRQKLDKTALSPIGDSEGLNFVSNLVGEIEELFQRYNALFEWADGPLVRAMKRGELILLDEMSLAEDAVLERLNSVLEPNRTLVLAEKGAVDSDASRVIKAHDSFQLFATMNPGGDFGKRELSPALRSRFTEIWVPPVTDKDDIGLVLEQALSDCNMELSCVVLKPLMMNYVEWFNEVICADPAGACADLSLSLRDILTWARFVVDSRRANHEFSVWDAYLHGARLMHLDGLGLGSGLSTEVARSTQISAEAFLSNQLILQGCLHDTLKRFQFKSESKRFGADPFWISMGFQPGRNEAFKFGAPTTAMNILRVLRAMQLSKPVLLEGSPGVGKTSLIIALAAASGHNLVRINLSEQTDMADLIGSDLPVPSSDSSSSGGASFRWFDGVLLSAIKNGDWILLDELNLASQSVLEGLNSCLDHRATVYVPELGQTFDCPPTFRVFAAQNPLAQGGGRKGLPRSFLNRFTKVYFETLSGDDLRLIVKSRFPSQTVVDSMVEFNARIHSAVVEASSFGRLGSPWEFNLRDVFRWCDLVDANKDQGDDASARLSFARNLYFQRFRSCDDRSQVKSIYSAVFGDVADSIESPVLKAIGSSIYMGDVVLTRTPGVRSAKYDGDGPETSLPLSLFEPMETVARCVAMGWPCLLVGSPLSGKATLVRSLAELSNSTVIEISLSSSSDVAELIGCFEQVDRNDRFSEAARSLIRVADTFLLYGLLTVQVEKISALLFRLQHALDSVHTMIDEGLYCARELSALLSNGKIGSEFILQQGLVSDLLHTFQRMSCQGHDRARDNAHFAWKDGVLVQAMTEGHWLHLRNVNLCPSSVLDRLNPVLEPGGSLLLAECGADNEMAKVSHHREVRCHSNFRVFLSMNHAHGEVSRAMRNRCVEISVLRNVDDGPKDFFDSYDAVSQTGLRSAVLASSLLRIQADRVRDNDTVDNLERFGSIQNTGSAFVSLALRGMQGERNLFSLMRLLQNGTETLTPTDLYEETACAMLNMKVGAIPSAPKVKESWALSPLFSSSRWKSRLLRLYVGSGESLPTPVSLLPSEASVFQQLANVNNWSAKYEMFLPFLKDTAGPDLRNHLLALFLGKIHRENVLEAVRNMNRLEGSFKNSVSFLTNLMQKVVGIRSDGESSPRAIRMTYEKDGLVLTSLALFRRMPQILKERVWFERICSSSERNALTQMTVLSVSFCIYDGQIEKNVVDCPLTPCFFTLFLGLDQWIHVLVDKASIVVNELAFLASLESLLAQRDTLWNLLAEALFSFENNYFLGFEETEFIVQWLSFRNSLRLLQSFSKFEDSHSVRDLRRRLDIMVDSVESVVFGHVNGGSTLSSSISKYVSKPIVPRKAGDWVFMSRIRSLSRSCIIERGMLKGNSSTALNLWDLVDQQHTTLVITDSFKKEILGALCTMQLAYVDEVVNESLPSLRSTLENVPIVLHSQLLEMKTLFSLELRSLRLDKISGADENALDVEEMKTLLSKTSGAQISFSRLSKHLLRRFSEIQIAACAGHWCEHAEASLIRALCTVLTIESKKKVRECVLSLQRSIEKLVEVALARALWDVADLRPYQTLLWLFEGSKLDDHGLDMYLRRVLPTMFCNASKRSWLCSSDLFYSIPLTLELPLVGDAVISGENNRNKTCGPVLCGKKEPRQTLPDAFVFSLVGGVFQFLPSSSSGATFATIENYEAREAQSCNLVEIFASCDPLHDRFAAPYEINYLLAELINALGESSLLTASQELVALLKKPQRLCEISPDQLRDLLSTSTNPAFRTCVEPLVLPLFQCLERLWCPASESAAPANETFALAKIYVGLLRYHLLLPDSPLDPGLKPIAKVALIERRLSNLGIELAALQLDSGGLSGDFSPKTEATKNILCEGDRLIKKRSKQKGKIIERPYGTPPFFELYRETRDFATTHASLESVLSLTLITKGLVTGDHSQESILRRQEHWQMNAEAFCERLLTKFEVYEDVIVPLVSSVGIIKEGLDLLVQAANCSRNYPVPALSTNFPLRDFSSGSDGLISVLHSISTASQILREYQLSLALGILSQLLLKRKVISINKDIVVSWFSVLSIIFNNFVEPPNESTKTDSDEEKMEKEFREQFPDHRESFQRLLHEEVDEIDHDQLNDVTHGASEDNISGVQMEFPEKYTEMVCYLHQEFFSEDNNLADDSYRIKMFRLCYDAAFKAFDFFGNQNNALRQERGISSGNVLALSLASLPCKYPIADAADNPLVSRALLDFHRDPHPIEATKAAAPLERLMARISQLQAAFPENAVLAAVANVADSVRKLDVLSTALGKVMTGLEIILKHSQDWEQHASDRVKLGEPLVDVGRVVSSWRKLELQSWPELLRTREERYASRGRVHWARIHLILRRILEYGSDGPLVEPRPCIASPRWVWKGLVRDAKQLTTFVPDSPVQITEIVKALDTFCLTSPLGEFGARLTVLRSFVRQIEEEANILGAIASRIQLARVLKSLWLYYDQFSPILADKLAELRRPFETRLQQEVKLAKWDEQTYYAMAESNERNHRKLMRMLKEYDQILELSTSTLLESELCRGVRSDTSAEGNAASTIPSESSLFGLGNVKFKPLNPPISRDVLESRAWTDASLIGVSVNDYAGKIYRLSQKMKSMLGNQTGGASEQGFLTADDLCESIFQRISTLRSAKTTRPMKERALTDLLRELKQQGYSSSPWSVPKELRQMKELFQLPFPVVADDMVENLELPMLQSSENYYQRCLAEIYRLRAEVSMLGSDHMTATQLGMILGFGEHGLFLLAQQRCILCSILSQRKNLSEVVDTLAVSKSLPLFQRERERRLSTFQNEFSYSLESMRQFLLLVKSSQHLLIGEAKQKWSRDSIVKLESFLTLVDSSAATRGRLTVVSNACIIKAEVMREKLAAALSLLEECRGDCIENECLPPTAFSACLSQIHTAVKSAKHFFNAPAEHSAAAAEDSDVDEESKVAAFVDLSSRAVHAVLLSIQACAKDIEYGRAGAGDEQLGSIWNLHRSAARNWALINVGEIDSKLQALLDELVAMHEIDGVDKSQRDCCAGLAADIGNLYSYALAILDQKICEYLAFYRGTAKLQYVLLRIFRVLAAKGFCSDKASEDDSTDGAEGNVSGMTFEDGKEGTGMGEGDGNRDVTDQIENEEQLLGLKVDENNDNPSEQRQPDSKQLDDEEAEKGMEMEADFDGDMYDLPDKNQDEVTGGGDSEDEDEVDREMGTDGGPNEQVIDEKLWDESDDEDSPGQGNEKIEQNSSVKGDGAAEEMMTKEEGSGDEPNPDRRGDNQQSDQKDEVDADAKNHEEQMINDDSDERYEVNQGVNVRDENEKNEVGDDNEIKIDDNLSIDEGENENEELAEKELTEEEPIEGDAQGHDQELQLPTDDQSPIDQGSDGEDAEAAANVCMAYEGNDPSDDDPVEDKSPEDDNDKVRVDLPKETDPHRGLGIRNRDGNDAVEDDIEDDDGEKVQGETEETSEREGTGNCDMEPSGGGGNSSGPQQGHSFADKTENGAEYYEPGEVPNPLKSPGDASKFWHKKLNIIESQLDSSGVNDSGENVNKDDNMEGKGDFEYAGENQENTTQALGETEDIDSTRLEDKSVELREEGQIDDNKNKSSAQSESNKRATERKSVQSKTKVDQEMDESVPVIDKAVSEGLEEAIGPNDDDVVEESKKDSNDVTVGNQITSDMSQLRVEDENMCYEGFRRTIIQEEQSAVICSANSTEARTRWSMIQSETHNLSRQLCEKLRLVMEPLVASKLRGDYRTGKRINMKRVIGYIASGYRKDKIWLRRTKPAKRNYRVLVAVDDSESMLKSGAGEMALKAMATLAVGMSQLEVGEVGVASFGNEMNLVHPFHQPFTSESGSNVVRNFQFDQQRTRTALCVESALMALEDTSGDCASMQLVFMISDGRIERDSRATIRRLVREMIEQNILLVLIIVEGSGNKKDSIINMKEVTFEKGKPKVKHFIEDYPFPYYIVLNDMQTLPEVLGDALRQWFEILGRLQTNIT